MKEEKLPKLVSGEKEKLPAPDKEVEMVEAIRVRTVFDDEKVLENIADKVHGQGLVSGFSIEPVEGGYFHEGKRVKEHQYALDFLLDPSISEAQKQKIIDRINEELKGKWETPAITEEKVQINKDLLGFVRRAEAEYGRYKRERRLRLSLTLTLLLAISGLIGAVTKRYVERREEKAVAAERLKEFKNLERIDDKIRNQIGDINLKLAIGDKGRGETIKSLEKVPGVEFGMDSYKEINDIEKTVDEALGEVRGVIKLEEFRSGKNK